MHRFLEPVFFEVETEAFSWFGEGGALMLVSLAVALLGIYIAYRLYVRDTDAARPPRRTHARASTRPRSTRSTWTRSTRSCRSAAPSPSPSGSGRSSTSRSSTAPSTGSRASGSWVGERLRPLQTGRVQNYAFAILAGMLVLVVVIAWVWGS